MRRIRRGMGKRKEERTGLKGKKKPKSSDLGRECFQRGSSQNLESMSQ